MESTETLLSLLWTLFLPVVVWEAFGKHPNHILDVPEKGRLAIGGPAPFSAATVEVHFNP